MSASPTRMTFAGFADFLSALSAAFASSFLDSSAFAVSGFASPDLF